MAMLTILLSSSFGCSEEAPEGWKEIGSLHMRVLSVESWNALDDRVNARVAIEARNTNSGRYSFQDADVALVDFDGVGYWAVDPQKCGNAHCPRMLHRHQVFDKSPVVLYAYFEVDDLRKINRLYYSPSDNHASKGTILIKPYHINGSIHREKLSESCPITFPNQPTPPVEETCVVRDCETHSESYSNFNDWLTDLNKHCDKRN